MITCWIFFDAFLDVSYLRENTDYLYLKCVLHVVLEQTRWEFPGTGGNTWVMVEHKHCLGSQGSMEGSLGWDPWRRSQVLYPHSVAFPFYRASICLAFQWGHNACLSIRQSEVRWQLFRERVCSACCQHWPTEGAQFFSVTVPDCALHNQWLRSWMHWATKFCLICRVHPASHQLPTTSSSILTTFLQGKCFHNQQDAENTLQVFLEYQSTDFYATGNKFISYWQKCKDCNGSYFSLIKICLRLIIMI